MLFEKPFSEKERLQNLYLYDILNTDEEKDYNDLVELAALMCDCPASAVSFVDADRQWFKARKGIADSETPINTSFCASAIQQNEVFEVEDALKDKQFSNYALVTGGLNIRFYAGSPVVSTDGHNLGTICVIDSKPKTLTEVQKGALKKLSGQVSKLLELRLLNRKLQQRSEKLLRGVESYQEFFNDAPYAQWIADTENYNFIAANRGAQNLYGYTEAGFLELTVSDLFKANKEKLETFDRQVKEKKKFSLVTNHKKRDGTDVVVELAINHIVINNVGVIIATIIDLSEKLQLQEKLVKEKKQTKKKVQHATLSAQYKEREHLGKELHDNINQMLTSTKLYLDVACANGDMRLDLIRRSREQLLVSMNEIRTLSKKLVEPQKDLDLIKTVEEVLEPYIVTSPFKLHYVHSGNLNKLMPEIKTALIRVIQESLTNITKYAEAKQVRIGLSLDKAVELCIEDDGKGYDTTLKRTSIGIRNMEERVKRFGGTLTVSSSPNQGCAIKVLIHLN
jgi:PAS domain S-box-containing protein